MLGLGCTIRLVQRLETELGFSVHPIYIRTYRNQLADWISREDLDRVHQELAASGWARAPEDFGWDKIGRFSMVAKQARRLMHPGDMPGRSLASVCLRDA